MIADIDSYEPLEPLLDLLSSVHFSSALIVVKGKKSQENIWLDISNGKNKTASDRFLFFGCNSLKIYVISFKWKFVDKK